MGLSDGEDEDDSFLTNATRVELTAPSGRECC